MLFDWHVNPWPEKSGTAEGHNIYKAKQQATANQFDTIQRHA